MELNLRRDFNVGCGSRELVRAAGSQSDVTATKSSSNSSSMSLEGRRFYRPLFAHCKALLAATFRDRGRGRKESLQLDRILCAFVAALALVSCNIDKIEVYSIPKKGVTVAMQNGSAGLPSAPVGTPANWVKPEGWSEQPLSEMRLGSFKVDGPNATSADVSVTAFPGDAGGFAPYGNRLPRRPP